MEKRNLVADIQARLKRAGYRVTQEDLSDGFRSAVLGRYCPALLKAWNIGSVERLADFLIGRGVPMLSPVGLELGDWTAKKAKEAERRQKAETQKAAKKEQLRQQHDNEVVRQEEEKILWDHVHFQDLARRARHRGHTCHSCGYHDPDGRYGVSCPNCELPAHLAAAM